MPEDAKAKQAGSNGGKARLLTLDDLDRRTQAYQRTAEILEGVMSDMGGADRCTTLERSLAESVAVMGAMIRDLEVRFLKGEAVDITEYTALINARRREATTIGLKRRARDVTPNIEEYQRAYSRTGAA
ncbi:MAG: hypothetical protein JJU21_03080 [Salinarimonas sp.]|nr:hypothetical protein [Salinarimonas sp.]